MTGRGWSCHQQARVGMLRKWGVVHRGQAPVPCLGHTAQKGAGAIAVHKGGSPRVTGTWGRGRGNREGCREEGTDGGG